MVNFVKAVSVGLIAVSSITFFKSCGSSKKIEQANGLAQSFCEAVNAGDTSSLMPYLADAGISEEELKEMISPSDINSEQADYLNTIKSTDRYELSFTNYDPELDLCFVTVNWYRGDYYSEQAVNAGNIQDLQTALTSAPELNLPSVIEVDFSGETPKIKNAMACISKVYSYTSEDNNVMPGSLADFYVDGNTVLAPKGVYTNTDSIGVRLNFSKDLASYRFVPGIIYTVAKGDEVLYVSDIINLEEESIRLDFNAETAGPDCLDNDGFIGEGKYTFMVFDEHSVMIASFDCVVEKEDVEQDEIAFTDHKNDYYLSNLVYEFKDDDLMANSYVFKSGWWDYDGTSVGKSAFASNTKTLGFSLAVSRDNEDELFYEYYYSEKSNFKDIAETGPVFESSCKPSLYDDQACYDLDYTPDELKQGFYGLVVYSDASKKHIVFTAACLVVKETSGDVIG